MTAERLSNTPLGSFFSRPWRFKAPRVGHSANRVRGWGREVESWRVMEELELLRWIRLYGEAGFVGVLADKRALLLGVDLRQERTADINQGTTALWWLQAV